MSLLRPHPRRYDTVRRLDALDPVRDAHEIYRTTVFYEFPSDIRTGFKLAFLRPFVIPRIANLLARTGELERGPHKRAVDTGLYMYELIHHGHDHPRGREVVRALNRVHRGWQITNEDYLYVLATFIVVPTRWIDQYGWRATTPIERAATHAFYVELGRRMAIRDLPPNYDAAAALLDDYERRYLAATPAGARLMAATERVIVDRLPRPLRLLARWVTSAVLDEPLDHALGLRPARRGSRAVVRAVLATRNYVHRRQPPATTSWFRPGQHNYVYSHGYDLSDLGPDSAHTAAGRQIVCGTSSTSAGTHVGRT